MTTMRPARLGSGLKFVTLLFFWYWLVYENIIFFNAELFGGTPLLLLTNATKLVLPFLLLVLTGFPRAVLGRPPCGTYALVFVVFLFWASVPTLLGGDPASWLKLLPRAVFFLSALALFSARPDAFAFFAKCLILYVLSALLQYVLVYVTGAYEGGASLDTLRFMAGPYGLLGNVNSMFAISGAPVPFVRLCGFWVEPSNAAGSAMAGFFLGRYLALNGAGRFWRRAAWGCLLAGILTLSTAGQFALGAALLFGVLFRVRRPSLGRTVRLLLVLPVPVLILLSVVYGRSYVAATFPDNAWVRALAGVRNATVVEDPTSGRLDLAWATIETARESVIGLGMQETGSEGIDASATAPLYWLLLTGFPGLILLLWRETILLRSGSRLMKLNPLAIPLVQALVAVMAQHLSYGSWMNPNYFILAAMVLVRADKVHQEFRSSAHPPVLST